MNVVWKPHPGPQTFALAIGGIRELLHGGARGGGKTDVGQIWLTKPPYLDHERYRALVIRRNSQDLSDWIDRAQYMYRALGGRVAGNPPIVTFPSGAIFRTGHLKDEKAFTKYVGHEYQKILIEELTQIARLEDYLKLISCCRSTIPEFEAKIFCTTNPGNVGHAWVKRRWGLGKRGRHRPNIAYRIPRDGRLMMYVPSTVADNPTIMQIDPAYVRFLDSLPEPLRTAWLYGDWDIFAGQVFAFYDIPVEDGGHLVAPIPVPEAAPLIMTFDWGFGKPYSVGWWWVDGDGRLYRFAELYGHNPDQGENVGLRQTDDEIAERIVAHEKAQGIWGRPILRLCDPTCFNKKPNYSGGGQGPSTAEVFASHCIIMRKGDPNRILGIRQFHARLRIPKNKDGTILDKPMLVVYDTCHEFIRTIPALQADEHNVEDVDTDLEDHIYDEAKLAVMSRPLTVERRVKTSQSFIEAALSRVAKKEGEEG